MFRKRLSKSIHCNNTVEVIEERGVRSLHLGTGAIQSSMRLSRPCDLELAYTRAMMAFLLFVPQPLDILMIGLGGGSLAKFIRKRRPEIRIRAVELNPQVVAAARNHFFLPPDDDCLQVWIEDGAVYVPAHPRSADVILLDGYDAGNQVEALATLDFYRACRRALKPGGALSVNLWGQDRGFPDYISRLVDAFDGQVCSLPVQGKTNVVVLALEGEGGPARLEKGLREAADWGRTWGLDLLRFARDLRWACIRA
ncbi:MAG TPA: methyltransferase domain-containing protein [Thiobacillaceae bacterium]|nr:methyltransferase domain-containing protein [Thiobacillaceae bacterium]